MWTEFCGTSAAGYQHLASGRRQRKKTEKLIKIAGICRLFDKYKNKKELEEFLSYLIKISPDREIKEIVSWLEQNKTIDSNYIFHRNYSTCCFVLPEIIKELNIRELSRLGDHIR